MSFATPDMLRGNEFATDAPAQPFSHASEIRFNSATKNHLLATGANENTPTPLDMTAQFTTASGNTLVNFEPQHTPQSAQQFASQMANDFLNNLKTSQLANEVNPEHLHFGLLDHQKHIKDMHFGLEHHTEALNHLHSLHTAQKAQSDEFHSGLQNHMDALNHLNKKQMEFGAQLEALSSKLDSLKLHTSSKHDEVTQCFGALNDVLKTHASNITELKQDKFQFKTSSNANARKKVIA